MDLGVQGQEVRDLEAEDLEALVGAFRWIRVMPVLESGADRCLSPGKTKLGGPRDPLADLWWSMEDPAYMIYQGRMREGIG